MGPDELLAFFKGFAIVERLPVFVASNDRGERDFVASEVTISDVPVLRPCRQLGPVHHIGSVNRYRAGVVHGQDQVGTTQRTTGDELVLVNTKGSDVNGVRRRVLQSERQVIAKQCEASYRVTRGSGVERRAKGEEVVQLDNRIGQYRVDTGALDRGSRYVNVVPLDTV